MKVLKGKNQQTNKILERSLFGTLKNISSLQTVDLCKVEQLPPVLRPLTPLLFNMFHPNFTWNKNYNKNSIQK
ncbi:hypothetical protein APS56_04660 [Pseudalgibacter alginicilyticus]|uniref:Uncharacterized protein n=1 Tax=Pseudalgibacter alginicilyticus TaxID=1736674 RepID=A0A0P0CEQ7_9FLAO|nr:hypothetical protein APS56_04660 [Pseudalgibacter alginicilyticus]